MDQIYLVKLLNMLIWNNLMPSFKWCAGRIQGVQVNAPHSYFIVISRLSRTIAENLAYTIIVL